MTEASSTLPDSTVVPDHSRAHMVHPQTQLSINRAASSRGFTASSRIAKGTAGPGDRIPGTTAHRKGQKTGPAPLDRGDFACRPACARAASGSCEAEEDCPAALPSLVLEGQSLESGHARSRGGGASDAA